MSAERKFFVDTNILVYAFDTSEGRKHDICSRLITGIFQGELAAYYISNQILCELFVVLTKRVSRSLSKESAGTIVRGFIDSSKWNKLNYDHTTVKRNLNESSLFNLSFWDLLIAQTMKDAGVKVLVTENVRDFSKVPWIKVLNPMTSAERLLTSS